MDLLFSTEFQVLIILCIFKATVNLKVILSACWILFHETLITCNVYFVWCSSSMGYGTGATVRTFPKGT